MSYIRDTAIVLKSESFREHDRMLTLFGKTHGKLRAVARGADRPQAKALGHLEPLSEVEVMIARGQSFDKLAVVRLVVAPSVRERLSVIAIAGSFAHLVDRLTEHQDPDERVYDLLKEVLTIGEDCLQDPSIERSRLLFSTASLRLMDILGYGPAFEEEHHDAGRLIKFLRTRLLKEALSITAPSQTFVSASQLIERALEETPLLVAPHGPVTIAALLG
ncbi:DNA repair protein RecO [Candidatus Uhrbacteria bacterium]|nr:DNA repair protein RecO [Candidatus Uhrbacteria bacterium]